jgi:release factor glutamine methyltransferase
VPSIAELLAAAAKRLESVSDSPRLDAEVLLAHAGGWNRTILFAWPERQVDATAAARFGLLLDRRCQGEPVAYLTGTREFWSRDFQVNPGVLIPRPETELLVEQALDTVAGMTQPRILDLGTGSGIVAITLAAELPKAQVTAVDVSRDALAVARGNAERHGIRNLRLLSSDWFSSLPNGERFDLIVSNPPYIAASDPHLSEGDVRFEPSLALTSGNDGLYAIRLIIQTSRNFLIPGGWLLFEHGWDQGQKAVELLLEAGYFSASTISDLLGNDRVSKGGWNG